MASIDGVENGNKFIVPLNQRFKIVQKGIVCLCSVSTHLPFNQRFKIVHKGIVCMCSVSYGSITTIE